MGFDVAKSKSAQKRGCARIAGRLAPVFMSLFVSGCMGLGMDDNFGVDARTVTGSVNAAATPLTDEAAVENSVVNVDLQRTPEGPFAWANPQTGSLGVISSVAETADAEGPCRDFKTSLHKYDGVSMMQGRTCRDAAGQWRLTAFAPIR